MQKRLPRKPIHPGEILREQFMAEFGVSMNQLARDLRVPVTRISEIVNQRRPGTCADPGGLAAEKTPLTHLPLRASFLACC